MVMMTTLFFIFNKSDLFTPQVETPLVKVIDVEGSATVKENLQQGDVRFSLLEGKPVAVHAVIKDFQYYEFTTEYSGEFCSLGISMR